MLHFRTLAQEEYLAFCKRYLEVQDLTLTHTSMICQKKMPTSYLTWAFKSQSYRIHGQPPLGISTSVSGRDSESNYINAHELDLGTQRLGCSECTKWQESLFPMGLNACLVCGQPSACAEDRVRKSRSDPHQPGTIRIHLISTPQNSAIPGGSMWFTSATGV